MKALTLLLLAASLAVNAEVIEAETGRIAPGSVVSSGRGLSGARRVGNLPMAEVS